MPRTDARPAGWPWLIALVGLLVTQGAVAADRPNIILIVCDDLGYADIGPFGATAYRTPNLDRMAAEGVKLTDFYVSSAVCSASRAALLTGCYHERVGIRGALGPKDRRGLGRDETTIAELLKGRGYATGMAGKWHLGCRPSQWPARRGFDESSAIPYSNDMWPHHPESPASYPPLPRIEGDRVADPDVSAEDQEALTNAFAARAVSFIRRHKDEPFFFYLAPSQPHVPLFVSAEGRGRSGSGLYGDVIAEIDRGVGSILATLDDLGIADRTLILFTSDNGPWLSYGDHAGSAGPLREGKGTSFEGGIRVPFLARWPGKIPARSASAEPVATIDLLPTVAAIVGAPPPDRAIDGRDIGPILLGRPGAKSPHESLVFYYGDGQLQAIRSGPWKLLFPHTSRTMLGQAPGRGGKPGRYRTLRVGSELYDLASDLGETKNLASGRPEVVARLETMADAIRLELGDSLRKQRGRAVRPATEAAD